MKNIFAVIGMFGTVVIIVACGVVALWAGNILLDVNRAPVVLETAVQTLEPISPAMRVEPGVIILSTSTPFPTAVPQVTATPYPTYTPLPTYTPAPLIDDRGLPSMGPYSLDQVEQCQAIFENGHIDTLPSPQRELCGQYVGGE